MAARSIPHPDAMEWQHMSDDSVHPFLINTFTDREWGYR
jgi:hypothetical protein